MLEHDLLVLDVENAIEELLFAVTELDEYEEWLDGIVTLCNGE